MTGNQETPSDQLKKEHEITMVVARAVEEEAAEILRTGQADQERIAKFRDFFNNFTDRCHHAKEERFYFPASQVYDGAKIGQKIAELTSEHAQFRAMLQELEFLGAQQDVDTTMIAERLRRYAELLRKHIQKENEILFAQADIVLPDDEKQAMMAGFHRIEKMELGEGFHAKYHDLAKQLSKK